jgi:hypothetical protein
MQKGGKSLLRIKSLGCLGLCTLVLISGAMFQQVSAETVLRVAMTAGDVPITIGQPDQGFEGYRFIGYNLYIGRYF